MRRIYFSFLLSLISLVSVGQVVDTTSLGKKARYNVNTLIKGRSILTLGTGALSRTYNSLINMTDQRIPFMTAAALRGGQADTARVVYVTDTPLRGFFYFDSQSTDPDNNSTVLVSGTRRYIKQIFAGGGSATVDASQLTQGTLDAARLPSGVAFNSGNATFTGKNISGQTNNITMLAQSSTIGLADSLAKKLNQTALATINGNRLDQGGNIAITGGGGGSIQSISGNVVNNTDPNNPVINAVPPGSNVSTFNNDAGYLTGINSTQVSNALGFLPANANALNGDNITTGTIPDARISSTFYKASDAATALGQKLNSSALSTINGQPINTGANVVVQTTDASVLTTGTIPDARLSTAITRNGSAQTLTNKTISGASNTLSAIPQSAVTNLVSALAGKQEQLVNGTNISSVNGVSLLSGGNISLATPDAASITTGTLPDARLSGNVVTLTGSQALSGKSIDGSLNTISNVPQASVRLLPDSLSKKLNKAELAVSINGFPLRNGGAAINITGSGGTESSNYPVYTNNDAAFAALGVNKKYKDLNDNIKETYTPYTLQSIFQSNGKTPNSPPTRTWGNPARKWQLQTPNPANNTTSVNESEWITGDTKPWIAKKANNASTGGVFRMEIHQGDNTTFDINNGNSQNGRIKERVEFLPATDGSNGFQGQFGQEVWLKGAFMIEPGADIIYTNKDFYTDILQLHHNDISGAPVATGPALAMDLADQGTITLFTRGTNVNVNTTDNQAGKYGGVFRAQTQVKRGEWNWWVMRVIADFDGDGSELQFWMNGKEVCNLKGTGTFGSSTNMPIGYSQNAPNAFYPKFGIYRTSLPIITSVWFANYEIGTSSFAANILTPDPIK